MKTSEEIQEIAKALSAMQGSMDPAKKDKKNPFFKSSYADLPSIWEAIRAPLVENGLLVVQDTITIPEGVSVCTRIIHVSGQWMEFGPLTIPVLKKDAQGVGSAITYGRRYSLGGALGVVDAEDDDGNRAAQSAPPPAKPKTAIPPPKHQDIDEWYLAMQEFYDGDEIRQYVTEASKIMKMDEQKTVNYLSALEPKKFNESFERWQKQQYDKEPAETEAV